MNKIDNLSLSNMITFVFCSFKIIQDKIYLIEKKKNKKKNKYDIHILMTTFNFLKLLVRFNLKLEILTSYSAFCS